MHRSAPFDMSPEEFRRLGYQSVDRIAEFLSRIRELPVTRGETPAAVRAALGDQPLPQTGADPGQILEQIHHLLLEHSLFNGHPRFAGYVTSSAAPIGALGDLLAAAFNPNVGAWGLAPIATEIEAQVVQWIADFIGYPEPRGGLLVSGGNMANLVGFWAARRAKADWDIRAQGVAGRRLLVYASTETHTWIHKAADLSGLGTDAIRWIPADRECRIQTDALRKQIQADLGLAKAASAGGLGRNGQHWRRGSPSRTGVHRPEYGLWFHVDEPTEHRRPLSRSATPICKGWPKPTPSPSTRISGRTPSGSGLRAGQESAAPSRLFRLLPVLLSLPERCRGGAIKLLRVWSPELQGLPRTEGLAGLRSAGLCWHGCHDS